MKKLHLIPLLGLTALLASCSLFSAKAPKFASEGDEYSYEEFYDKLNQAQIDSELSDYDSKLGDRVLKSNTYYSSVSTIKRERKVIQKIERTQTLKEEGQFDYDGLVGKGNYEGKYTEKSKTPEGTGSTTSEQKIDYNYQFGQVGKFSSLVLANNKTKQYYVRETVTASNPDHKIFDSFVHSVIDNATYGFFMYLPGSKAEAKDYLFFVNNNDSLFTFSYNQEKDDGSTSAFDCLLIQKIKVQLDLTDKKQALRVSYESNEERTYLKDDNGNLEGDILTITEKRYEEYTINAKDVSVKAVDLDSYSLINSGGSSY